MQKFYKIRSELTPDHSYVSWFLKGRDEFWRNYNGGRCPLEKVEILEVTESDCFANLDWRDTFLYDSTQSSGWLSPSGEFYGCPARNHEDCAVLVLHSTGGELERQGWVTVKNAPGEYHEEFGFDFLCEQPLTFAQIVWLKEQGYRMGADDVERYTSFFETVYIVRRMFFLESWIAMSCEWYGVDVDPPHIPSYYLMSLGLLRV